MQSSSLVAAVRRTQTLMGVALALWCGFAVAATERQDSRTAVQRPDSDDAANTSSSTGALPEFPPIHVVRREGQPCREEADCEGEGFCVIPRGEPAGVCVIEETVIDERR